MIVIDAGARFGPHPSWNELFTKGLCTIHAFEPEIEEFSYLQKIFKDNPRYIINNCALGAKYEFLTLNILNHKGQSSFLTPNISSNWFGTIRQNDSIITNKQKAVKVVKAEDYIIQAIPPPASSFFKDRYGGI